MCAAVALPAYQTYTIKAKVSEAILATSQCRTAISETYQTGSSTSAPTANGWGCENSVGPSTKYVNTVTTSANGQINVLTSTAADLKDAGGKTILLTPYAADGTTLLATAAIPTQVGAFKCQAGTIDPKYLPGSCK